MAEILALRPLGEGDRHLTAIPPSHSCTSTH